MASRAGSDPIRTKIVALCSARGAGRSIYPSEAARALAANEAEWRALMPTVRAAAGKLVASGVIAAVQKGAPVDPETARGPIRLRLADQTDGRAPARRQRSEQ
jgi:hypothetical protein